MGKNKRVLSSTRNKKKKVKLSKKSTLDGSAAGSRKKLTLNNRVKLRFKTVRGVKRKFVSRPSQIANLKSQRSAVLKRQATERMVLKEHLRDLEQRRQRIRKGENAKLERRELGKYIRQLKEEQQTKHSADLKALESELQRLEEARAALLANGASAEDADWEIIGDDENVDGELETIGEDELQNMFAHLVA